MAAISPIDAVNRAAVILAETGDPAAAFVAEALSLWLRDGGPELGIDQALGFAPGWRAAQARQRREQAIRDLARQWPTLGGRAAARAMVAHAATYESRGGWKRDCRLGHRPDGINGIIFDLLHLGPMLGEESIRKILTN